MGHGINETGACVKVTECRVCKHNEFYKVLDLGYHPLADTFLSKEQLSEPEVYYPLRTQTCPHCGLMQTEFVVSATIRYQENPYCFESSSSLSSVRHFNSLAERVSKFLSLEGSDLVVDIGSNDGTLLKAFKKLAYEVMGIDPSTNICEKANAAGIETLNDFFNPSSAKIIVDRKGKASVITATGVFNHVDDIYDLMKGVDLLLKEKGVLVIESPYLLDLIENLEYDTIYHEHLSYLSMKPLKLFFDNVRWEIFHVERISYLGGSIRLFIGRKREYQPDNSVDELLSLEKQKRFHEKSTFEKFAADVYKARDELVWLLCKLKREGNRIVAIGAPTKGNTLLNFCKIGTNLLDCASDVIQQKIGRYTPGSHIPIVDDATICRIKPEYGLLLSWNLAEEIIQKFFETLKFGGKFIIPVPVPRIVSKEEK